MLKNNIISTAEDNLGKTGILVPENPIYKANPGLNIDFSNLALMRPDTLLFGLGLIGDFINSNWPFLKNYKLLSTKNKSYMGANMGSDILDGIRTHIKTNNSDTTDALNAGFDMFADTLSNPYLKVWSKGSALLGDMMSANNLNTSQLTTQDKILDSNVALALPAVNILSTVNNIGSKTVDNFDYNPSQIKGLETSYTGATSLFDKAEDVANSRIGLFSSGKFDELQNLVKKANETLRKVTKIKQTNDDIQSLGKQSYLLQNYRNKINGIPMSKNGSKIEEWKPIIEDEWLPVIEEFKEGGSIKEQKDKNVIPEGNLHARLHHMDNDSNITKKGIPVIDNTGEQLAEIELNEIIFNLETTQQLEKLYKDGSDKAAIEAGKLLVEEILFNTDDRTGLINTLKKGGTLNETK